MTDVHYHVLHTYCRHAVILNILVQTETNQHKITNQ
jgi:hypothetical protein